MLYVLIAALFATTHAWALWDIKTKIPENLCGEYQVSGEVKDDGDGQGKVTTVEGEVYGLELTRIVHVGHDIMEVESVLKAKKDGKTGYLITFKDSSLVWALSEGDTPTRLAVAQSDKKDRNRSRVFMLERTGKQEKEHDQ